jgi:hypothetical protein
LQGTFYKKLNEAHVKLAFNLEQLVRNQEAENEFVFFAQREANLFEKVSLELFLDPFALIFYIFLLHILYFLNKDAKEPFMREHVHRIELIKVHSQEEKLLNLVGSRFINRAYLLNLLDILLYFK